jgi:hypothetical protein
MASPASVSHLSRDTATWKQSSSLSLPPIGSPSYTGGRNKRRAEKKGEDSIYRLSVELTWSRAERKSRASRFAIPDSRDPEIVLDKGEEHSESG